MAGTGCFVRGIVINISMASTPIKYYYAGQFKKYIGQFLKVFAGLQTQDGVDRDGDGINDMRSVSLVYGSIDRVIEKIVLQGNGTFTNQKIPIISAYLTNIKPGDEERIPVHHEETISYENTADGQYHSASRMAPAPYELSMDLHLYASNSDQMFQMLEQILVLFNPSINFQKSSAVLDWNYITRCTLTGIQDQTNFPMGVDRRVIVQTLNFMFVAWLNYPYLDSEGSVIDTIFLNMHDSSIVVEDLDTVTPPPDGVLLETIEVDSP